MLDTHVHHIDLEGCVHVRAEVDHAIDPVEETAWVSDLASPARADGVPGPLAPGARTIGGMR